jgi:hypothetical protein
VNQIRNMSDGLAENNYELFAVNVAVLVASLRRDYADRIPSEDALLATAGTLNLLPTMNAGLVSVEDMMRSVLDARQCQVRLGMAKLSHAHAGSPLSGADLMLNFVMQHAVVGFRATDDEMSDAEILDAVVENKRVMANALTRTNEVIRRGKLGSRVSCMSQALTKGFMESAETADMRQELGLRDA